MRCVCSLLSARAEHYTGASRDDRSEGTVATGVAGGEGAGVSPPPAVWKALLIALMSPVTGIPKFL